MVGAAGEVNVKAEPVGVGVYQCSYIPEACGESLEFIFLTSENQFIKTYKINVALNNGVLYIFDTGIYLMSVACGDMQALGSPYKVVVGCLEPPPLPPPVKCAVAIGPGLTEASLNKVAEFLIDGSCGNIIYY